MRYPRIIGFAGRKRSGKGVLANLLKDEENAVILTIANYLKFLCCDLINVDYDTLIKMKDNNTAINYYPDDRWFNIINKKTNISILNIKNTISNIKFTSVRQLLQVIGTDLIRRFNPNWHIEQLIKDIKSYSEDTLIAIDDVRFPNECLELEKLNAKIFYIIRPDWKNVSNHISEISLKWQDFNKQNVIINNKDLIVYKTEFLCKFRNGFDIKLQNSIFLSDNEQYITKYEDTLQDIFNKNNNPLMKESIKILL